MAYVDGELDEAARQEFEARLQSSSELRSEVSELSRLGVLARQAAPPEPMDYEWEAIAGDPVQRAMHPFAWLCTGLGVLALAAWSAWAFLADESIGKAEKATVGLTVGGLLLLFLLVLKNRLRTLPYDPYRDVRR